MTGAVCTCSRYCSGCRKTQPHEQITKTECRCLRCARPLEIREECDRARRRTDP